MAAGPAMNWTPSPPYFSATYSASAPMTVCRPTALPDGRVAATFRAQIIGALAARCFHLAEVSLWKVRGVLAAEGESILLGVYGV